MIIILIIFIIPLIPFIYGVYRGIIDYTPVNDEVEVNEAIESEIAMIEYNINRRIESANILEDELKKDIEPLKRARLLNQLNTLDKQTFKDYKRIEELKESENGG